ncbi:MAG: SDR family NAD(P)-dependent oxidoreductase [Burkholderiales bacterium]
MLPSLRRIVVVSPFEQPDPELIVSAGRAGALGVLDLGRDEAAAKRALARLAGEADGTLGVRLPPGVALDAFDLPPSVGTLIVDAGDVHVARKDLRVLVQVTDVREARAAHAAGAYGLIAKGNESGGRVGDETSFVLLQRLADAIRLPIWVQGGVGLHTAAACVAGGAAGVVLDAQVSLVREATLPPDVRAAIAAMDGSETTIIDGHRVFVRPDLPIRELAASGGVARKLGGRDLKRQLLPAGQDAAFAKPLADRFRTIGGLVRGIDAAIEHDVSAARRQHALAEDAPLAADLGIRYPIFQGPMTRVSDRAQFAERVAAAGGLPFLALALMRGPEVESLLAETSQRLAGRTFGVGILGFVPAELRDEQIEVVKRLKPPVALIAGGRPAQAKPLEELGIATFLHTPSPGLLDLFLKQGARRFVFEGSECGGHVGPRTSFALWDAQIARLLAHPAPQELEVVFAGGIHDARSAAMVAAMAAPLVERGASIGVLMGTAYLFTPEAVACGAIQPGFQQAAIACDATVLLETAPGHSTRCADTEYVRMFREERERMQREGLAPQDMWLKLEELNLGRLRIAAKGLKRDGDRIVEVDADAQKREGMVMLGQVAALREKTIALADLHRDVATGSATYLATLPDVRAHGAARRDADVAIVGMAAIMPGAHDLATFWANIVNGVNSIREVPPQRWNAGTFYDPKSLNGEMTPSKWGGFLDPYPFDPLTYGIPPLSLAAIEPVQLLSLEASRRALADAGYAEREFDRDNTSVIFGAEAGTDLASAYGFRALWRQYAGEMPKALAAALPTMTEDSFPGILGNVIAGRIANRLDLGGANFTVDAACASSLAAVDLACKELVAGTSNMVICGGADLHNSIVDFLAFSSVHALSPSGQCRTFDAGADGIALGEGVCAVVLKRLADAERDGDRIYAVIKAVGSGSDGKSLGLTAPRAQGQARTLERAYERAGVDAREVGMVEAHGTGTVVGDRTELETLNRFFGGAGAAPGSIALGSIKSQIGHTKCAAGLAGLMKSALSLHHRVLPPTLNIKAPNPGWSPACPFTLSDTARPWAGRGRRAGVSAFGFGGTNFHAVLAEHEAATPESGLANWPAELFVIRGGSRADALARLAKVERLAATGEQPFKDLARSATGGEGAVHIAIVARDAADLAKKIPLAREGKSHASGVFVAADDGAATSGKLAFLFPGQGSQRVGMLADLFIAFPSLARYLELGARWRDTMFPPTAWTQEEADAQRAAITDTRVAQPALGIAGLAVSSLLQRLGVRPDMVAGHSYGELVALCVAGALPESALPELSELRGRRILESCAGAADPGTMAAVAADPASVAQHLAGIDGVVIANENSPEQAVISGPKDAVERAVARLLDASVAAKTIPVACAFHSPLVRDACRTFAEDLAAAGVATPALPVYSNTTAGVYPDDPDAIRARLAEHIGMPVRFAAEVEAMYDAGARVFVEAGPGRVLTGLVSRILRGRPHVAIACDRPGDPGVVQLLLALGQLAVNGVPVDVDALFAGRDAQRFPLDAPPRAARTASTWWVDGQRAWPMHGEPPANALRPVTAPVVTAGAPAAASGGGEREAVMLEYLRGMREMAEAQRRAVMSYLGQSEPAAAPAIEGVAQKIAPAALPEPDAAPAPVAAATEVAADKPFDVKTALLDIVAQRTGYPLEMLDLDLDLEADLSIDSIKRVEILGAVAEQLRAGVGTTMTELPDDLVAVKTLRGMIDALSSLVGAVAAPAPVAVDEPPAALPAAPDPEAVDRFVVELAPSSRAEVPWALADREISIVGAAQDVDDILVRGLAAAGSRGKVVAPGDAESTRADVLVDLTPLREDWEVADVPALFGRVRDALLRGASHVLVAGTANGYRQVGITGERVNGALVPASGGVSGMIKSLRKEWPDRSIRVANFESPLSGEELAARLIGELNAGDEAGEVGFSHDGVRHTPRVVRAERADTGSAAGNKSPVDLGPESVVLVTGGARGITAAVATALASRFGCTLELVGRTPAPAAPEDADLAQAADERALRQALIARRTYKGPAEIEAACARFMAEREIRATLAAIGRTGARCTYHPLDVRDTKAFGRLIDDIYARHGRLDGVIHGAGVIEDKLARDKTPDSFARVFETKVNGALVIAEKVRHDIGFIVFFSSIAATYGSRGQADYAAANDFLDRLAVKLNATLEGRVFSINWGPWGVTGMVSPQLTREYAKRGIGLIQPEAGVESFLDELLHGSPEDAQVILMRGDPTAMA